MTTDERIKKFFNHLDSCSQCMNNSFGLCQEGSRLLLDTKKFTGERRACILCDQNIPHANCDRG